MKWLDSFLAWAWVPKSKFKRNDCVHTLEGETLMIVKEIHCSATLRSHLILCSWYEEGNVFRTNLFPEEMLTHFDWESYRVQKMKQDPVQDAEVVQTVDAL
jgi:uncharacterized protein YodC (DUF2158 family)